LSTSGDAREKGIYRNPITTTHENRDMIDLEVKRSTSRYWVEWGLIQVVLDKLDMTETRLDQLRV